MLHYSWTLKGTLWVIVFPFPNEVSSHVSDPKLLTVLSRVAPVEAVLVDVAHRVVAGAVEEAPLVVAVVVSQLHVALLDL